MNYPQRLVDLYRKFWRADKKYNPSTVKVIQPLAEGCLIIEKTDIALRSPDFLVEAVAGRLLKLMRQVHGENIAGAKGRRMIGNPEEERQAILEFANYLVKDVFYGAFSGDLGRFAGKQRELLEDTCEFIYRLEQDKENAAQKLREPYDTKA